MIKEKLNSKKGITLVALVMTIVILLILTGATIEGIKISNNEEPYNNMIADIKLLEEKIFVYYSKYKEIPKTEMQTEINSMQYYEIDLSKLENLTLKYGTKSNGNDDIYLVNDNLEVYYLKGVKKSEEMHHTKVD